MKKKRRSDRGRFTVLEGQGRRFSFRTLAQALLFYTLLLVALVAIVQLGQHWLSDQYLAWRLQIVTAEPGEIARRETLTGLVTRSEVVFSAPADGMVIELAPAGVRVPAGADLALFGVLPPTAANTPGREEEEGAEEEVPGRLGLEELDFIDTLVIQTGRAGFVSHYLDGWEEHSGPHYLNNEELSAVAPQGYFRLEGDRVKGGEPLVKVVDNWRWHFNAVTGLHPGQTLAGQRAVEIEFDFAPGQSVRALLHEGEVDSERREVRLSYTIDRQLPGFDQARLVEASLLHSRYQGIMIPAEAVFEKDQVEGVFLNQGGKVVFQPVRVIAHREEELLVEGIEAYSLVITRPSLVEEGRRLN